MKFSILVLCAIAACMGGCIKDRVSTAVAGTVNVGDRKLIHYWSFNQTDDTAAMRRADSTIGGGRFDYDAAYIDSVQPGSSMNVRLGADSGGAVRLRNPYNSMTIHVPTTGYTHPVLTLCVQTSGGSGPTANNISYSTDGVNYTSAGLSADNFACATEWKVYSFDFSGIPAANDNPLFRVRLTAANNNTGVKGNNRYDNITIDARKK